jgi:chromosome segregation ATPase
MQLRKFIIILPLLWWGFDAHAQVPEEPSSMPEQWQLTLDVIKSKAQTLLIENNGLQLQYRQLTGQVQKLKQSIIDQQDKNEQMTRLIKERHGRTDQQMRIDELTQVIKAKKKEARISDEQLASLTRKKSDLDRKLQQLKYTISDIELHAQNDKEKVQAPKNIVQPQGNDQLAQWRKQLEDENRQEVLLQNELADLKTGGKMQNLNVDAIDDENKQFEAHLDVLRLQKLRYVRKSSDDQLAGANARMYDYLKKRKEELEANISVYEARMDELRESSLMAMSWPLKKKKLVHAMVQTDAHNNQMRDKIKVLHEDIGVLRDQIARLERRVDFAQGKDTKQ